MDTLFKPAKLVKRGNTYQLYYYNPDGYRRRLSVGPDRQQAQRLLIRFTDWLLEGKNPEREMERAQQKEQAKQVTLREFYPLFLEKHGSRQSKSMQKLYGYCFNNLCRCPQLADIPIGNLSQRDMSDYMDLRMKHDRVKPATVNREATFVKCMLGLATRRGILDRNPLQGFKLLKESSKREVNIKPEQIARLIEALPESMGNIVEFAVYTGFRRENVLGLKIEQVRFHDLKPTGEVNLFVKGGRWETKPLKTEAVDVLNRAIGNRTEGYVFINPKTGTRYHSGWKTFDRVVRKLGLTTVAGEKLCFHDLRRVFATWMLEGGAGIEAVQYFLGHRSITTTTRYTSVNRKVMGEALKLLPTIQRLESKKASAGA